VTPWVDRSQTKVALYRLVGGVWKPYLTIRAQNFQYVTAKGVRYSTYWANTTLPYSGTWSAVATFDHPDYYPTSSSRFVFTVK
jgi:hypothetical protein